MNNRMNSGATVLVLLGLLVAASFYRKPLVLRPARVDPPMVVQTKEGMILVARFSAKAPKPERLRGAALRDRGEAFGGGSPEFIEVSTATFAAQ